MSTEYIKTIECPKCRYKNVAGTKFCGDCGTALDSGVPLNCDKCGAVNPPSQKFCGTCGNSLVANADTDPDIRHLQEVLKERYVILKSLGEGGFGRVFLAEHTGLKQKHVIKVLSADSSRNTDIRNRFFQEAQVIARLKHPNIVPIMDVSESGGRPYYIMSYLEGGSLEDLLLKEKKLSIETALGLVSKLLSALSEVHKKGIIHRDIKPSNVLLDETGEPILIDFGIARVEESTGSKTKTGISIGTPQYMSPEQLDAKPINLKTDIYSMGILLFELLTGKPPFEGSISSLITQHNSGVMPSVSSLLSEAHLVEELQFVIQKACAKEPGGRFSSAWEMREAVNNILLKSKKDTKKESELVENREITPKETEIQREDNDVLQSETEKPLLKGEVKEKKLSVSSKLVKSLGAVVVLFLVGLGIYFTQEEDIKVSIPSGKTFKNSIGMEFVEIPAGEFMMGCSKEDKKCYNDEKPSHKVIITNSFYIGKYEVTQGQWKQIMRNDPSYFQNCGTNCPVENVNWNDIQLFIHELNLKEGKRYRLPTESEWEYSARAGSRTTYFWGSEESGEYSWYQENSNKKTYPVGLRKPNAWGLYDMIGNVWEWTNDWYELYYERTNRIDPKGPIVPHPGSNWRVLRGGSSYYCNFPCRVSTRFPESPDNTSQNPGFRLVFDP
jgi:serine/threonine protein kinase